MTEQPRESTEHRTQEGLNFRMLQLLTRKDRYPTIDLFARKEPENLKKASRKFFQRTQNPTNRTDRPTRSQSSKRSSNLQKDQTAY